MINILIIRTARNNEEASDSGKESNYKPEREKWRMNSKKAIKKRYKKEKKKEADSGFK